MLPNITKKDLTDLAKAKLRLAAEIIKATAGVYKRAPEEYRRKLLPLWGGGTITHGLPNGKWCVVGTSEAAMRASKGDTTKDHLFRVTKTAEVALAAAEHLNIDEIEDLLLSRAPLMRVTKKENRMLRELVNKCTNDDDWVELYRIAGIEWRPVELSAAGKKRKTKPHS